MKEALKLVIHNKIFEFGDCFFNQLSGCAMGTTAACVYTTIYYAYHERKTLLPKYKNNLLFFKRLIDDMFGIWKPSDDPNAWENFKEHLSFGILEWEM